MLTAKGLLCVAWPPTGIAPKAPLASVTVTQLLLHDSVAVTPAVARLPPLTSSMVMAPVSPGSMVPPGPPKTARFSTPRGPLTGRSTRLVQVCAPLVATSRSGRRQAAGRVEARGSRRSRPGSRPCAPPATVPKLRVGVVTFTQGSGLLRVAVTPVSAVLPLLASCTESCSGSPGLASPLPLPPLSCSCSAAKSRDDVTAPMARRAEVRLQVVAGHRHLEHAGGRAVDRQHHDAAAVGVRGRLHRCPPGTPSPGRPRPAGRRAAR